MNWNCYGMRKFGGGIRKEIEQAFVPFLKAKVYVAMDKEYKKMDDDLGKLLSELPDEEFIKV